MELFEDNFIHEEYKKNPSHLWKWFSYVISCTILFGGGLFLYGRNLANRQLDTPSLRVTNRDFSIFLWQNPSLMRAWAKNKNGYLPAFEAGETIGLNPEYAQELAIASPEVLFLYHAWDRLIRTEFPARPISGDEFATFLLDAPEWQPKHWKEAPKAYSAFVRELSPTHVYTYNAVPWDVLRAFIGWKNYFHEGHEINALKPSKEIITQFLSVYPHYARTYWYNIVGSSYLQSYENADESSSIPATDIPPFLRVALYNFIKQLDNVEKPT